VALEEGAVSLSGIETQAATNALNRFLRPLNLGQGQPKIKVRRCVVWSFLKRVFVPVDCRLIVF
jgi:hypothetical protein